MLHLRDFSAWLRLFAAYQNIWFMRTIFLRNHPMENKGFLHSSKDKHNTLKIRVICLANIHFRFYVHG